jgi:hypothetical protein
MGRDHRFRSWGLDVKSVARSFVVAAVSSAAVVFSLQPALALTDYLPADTDLALYFNESPGVIVTQVDLTATASSTSTTGTVGTTTVNFSSTESFSAANGNATIKPIDTGLNQLTITMPGFTFGDFKFSAQLLTNNPGQTPPTDLTVNITTVSGSATYTFHNPPVAPNSNGDFFIEVTGIADITQVELISILGIKEIKQFAFADLTCFGTNCPPPGPGPGSTPLPAAVWLFGTIIAGGAGVSRWRKRRQARMIAA